MERPAKLRSLNTLVLMVVAAGMFAAGCTSPRAIVGPDAKELSTSQVAQCERDGFTLRATMLPKKQGERLLSVDVTKRAVAPVLFVINNQTKNPYLIRREHFALRIGQFCIEPALPGRAAALLRDSSGSQGATYAGWLVFGILAAPSIDDFDKKETASIEAHRELIFSETHLLPGATIAGYLFFESPSSLKKVQKLELELRISGDRENLISLQLDNPYATQEGEPMQ